MITIVNKHHFKNQPLPEGTIPIHRPSPLGNPYSHLKSKLAIPVSTREESIIEYKKWLPQHYKPGNPVYHEIQRLLNIYLETGSLTLACFCKEKPGGKPIACHGDVIKEVIEALAERIKHAAEKPESSNDEVRA